jgi:anaerobic selenocysteine-containing dehydrogenase
MTITEHHRTCPLCEATCGLTIEVADGAVRRIRGDRDDVFSHGYLCPKGSTLKQLHEDPDRLRRPLVRRDGVHVEVSWEEAWDEVDRRLTAVRAAHGNDSVALYLGNPNAHTIAGAIYGRPLIQALGTKNLYSASTVDQMPQHVACGHLFGNPGAMPVPDLDRTDYLLMLGANPLASNGSLCTAPDFPGRLAAIRDRGGRVLVVDPRRTRTAEVADEHLPIRPGTDALWLFALLHVVVHELGVRLGAADGLVRGLAELPGMTAPFTPEAVAAHCGIDATTTRRVAGELADGRAASVYTRIGTHTQTFGTLCAWAGDVLNLVTGNLDRAGGAMWATPCHGRPHVTGRPPGGRGFRVGRWHSRVSGHPEVRAEFPVAALSEEIETPGEGQVRCLITVAGNPARSTPESERLERALASLEFMVAVDIYLNETTRHADVVLPPPSALEKSHFDLAFYGLSVRNVANWSPPVFPADGPSEGEILAKLALIAGGMGAAADASIIDDMIAGQLAQQAVSLPGGPLEGRTVEELLAEVADEPVPERHLDLLVRSGPYGDHFGARPDGLTMAVLRSHPHGVDLGPLQPRLVEVLRTTSGAVELDTPAVVGDVERLRDSLATPPADGLVLVGRRHLRSNNSWMHNIEVLVKGRPRCTLQVHPDDAARLGLVDGSAAAVRSRVGSLVAPVEVTDAIRPGVVSLPHGWGHDDDGARLEVASRHAGVNSNVLTDGSALDPLSGNCALNAIPVDVVPA